jgi:putative lipoprotein
MSRWYIIPFVVAMLAAFAGNGLSADKPKVTGMVEFKGDAEFDKETVAIIRIQDVSLADAPAKTIGEKKISDLKSFPIMFEVEYDPAEIKDGHTYALSVRIETKGKLDYINDTRIPVISKGSPTTDVKAPVIRVKRN